MEDGLCDIDKDEGYLCYSYRHDGVYRYTNTNGYLTAAAFSGVMLGQIFRLLSELMIRTSQQTLQ